MIWLFLFALNFQDEADTNSLLAANNINNNKLEEYAYQAAHYATEEKLPTSDCAKNYKGKPDIAMFDFTSRKQAKQAVLSIEADGKVLILGVVGDSLKEVCIYFKGITLRVNGWDTDTLQM